MSRVEPMGRLASPARTGVLHVGALPDEVHYPRLGDIPAGPARTIGPQAEIDLFVVDEIAFVQQADRIEDLAADDQARAGDPIDLASIPWDGRFHHPLSQELGNQAEARPALKLAEDRRESKRRPLWRAVGIFKPATG